MSSIFSTYVTATWYQRPGYREVFEGVTFNM